MAKKIDTETIMINLLKEDEEQYCSIDKIQKLCAYIYQQLIDKELLKNYFVKFAIDFESIERTVLYNNKMFYLDIDGDIVYLRESYNVDDLVDDFQIDDTIKEMIREFNRLSAA